jgi:protein arginine N-methyltransferase 3
MPKTVSPRPVSLYQILIPLGLDIHAVMINDKVRTASYAQFILTNPYLFRDAVVLDVGCGTGILSLFAARSGAKKVIAVDASDIVERAKKIVKVNGLEDTISVVRGKVEDVTLPDGITQVDIIISEWMGYALLYESMLDSVLVARDRFLKPGGVMAPSQTKILLALCDAKEIHKDRIGFWNDVYGTERTPDCPAHVCSLRLQVLICRRCQRGCMMKLSSTY